MNIELYELYSKFYYFDWKCNSILYIENKTNKKLLLLLKKLDENFAMLFANDNDDPLFKIETRIILWRESEISEVFPANLWNASTQDIKIFSSSEEPSWLEYIIEKTKYKSVIVRKIDRDLIEVKAVVNRIISVNWGEYGVSNYSSGILKTYEDWKVEKWIWKPTKLVIYNWDSDSIAEDILNMQVISSIRKLEYHDDSENTELDSIIQISEMHPEIDIEPKFVYYFNTKETCVDLKIYSDELVWISNGKVWYFKIVYDNFALVSWLPDPIKIPENEDFFAFKIIRIFLDGLILKGDIKSERIKEDSFER